MGDSVGLETQRPCQPFPGPRVPVPRWSTAGFPRLMLQEQSEAFGEMHPAGTC